MLKLLCCVVNHIRLLQIRVHPIVTALDRDIIRVPAIDIVLVLPLADVGWTGGIAHTPDVIIVTYLLTNKPGAFSSTVNISAKTLPIDWGPLLLNFFNGSIVVLNSLSCLISAKIN